jgi:flavodoxin
MPKVVILYDTLSGTTELLVKAVIEGLGTLEEVNWHKIFDFYSCKH